MCLLLSSAYGYRVNFFRRSSNLRTRALVACDSSKDLAAELQARQAARQERPTSKGLPALPGTQSLPPAAQIGLTLFLVAVASFAFDGGAWLYT